VGLEWGETWDRGSFTLVGSYQTRGDLKTDKRRLSASNDYTAFGGPNNNVNFCNPGNVLSVDGVTPLPGLGGATYAAVPSGFRGTPTVQEFQGTAGTLNSCSQQLGNDIVP